MPAMAVPLTRATDLLFESVRRAISLILRIGLPKTAYTFRADALAELQAHCAQHAIVDGDVIAGGDLERYQTGPGRHHFVLGEGQAMLRQLVREPGQRNARVAQNISADALAFEMSTDPPGDAVRGEIEVAPCGRRLRPEHELM